ncbi:MAG: hypothetical protein COZ46_01910 [Verrucomicrobia bacterium CG_4_10_14_3_um_filter_43_23]|nr:MAG: hypothetical protein AUJ82_01925 [Verrucomicrobia bacterium CG1_02_43_26]PIP59653.1 MAG: hypothetical protein COX01_03515 [Verrucomicrobia bacterium CG22_combo_CG10-13_8_21_14_all_43_17]PIX58952.1 MAG: hypothetical protein COZ46_01910 [Verrucomicrobia bacterium CG_4_10_14_3_um_filter_43_23]PJA43604.1 MAG: hypothetical protein CO175_07185 [Verrucomicrobia bacterium CG_4_9_14_3_um_filter_43_20]
MPILRRRESIEKTIEEKKETVFEEIKNEKKETLDIPLLDLSSLNKKLNKTGLKEGEYQIVILDEQLEDRKVSKEDNLLELKRDIKKLVTKSKSDSALKRRSLQIENKEQQIVNRLSLSPTSIRMQLSNGNEIITKEVISHNQPIIINILNEHSCSSGKSSRRGSTDSSSSRPSIDFDEIKSITDGDGINLLSKGPSVVASSLKNIAGFMPNYGIFMVSGGTLCFIVGLGVGAAVGVAAEGVGVVPGMAIGGASGLILGITGGLAIDVGITVTKKIIKHVKKQQALKQQTQNRIKKQPSLVEKTISRILPKKATI